MMLSPTVPREQDQLVSDCSCKPRRVSSERAAPLSRAPEDEAQLTPPPAPLATRHTSDFVLSQPSSRTTAQARSRGGGGGAQALRAGAAPPADERRPGPSPRSRPRPPAWRRAPPARGRSRERVRGREEGLGGREPRGAHVGLDSASSGGHREVGPVIAARFSNSPFFSIRAAHRAGVLPAKARGCRALGVSRSSQTSASASCSSIYRTSCSAISRSTTAPSYKKRRSRSPCRSRRSSRASTRSRASSLISCHD